MQLSIRADIKQVERTLSRLERRVLPKAAATAINKTLKNVQTQAVRGLSKSSGLRQKSIRERLRLIRATRDRLTGELLIVEHRHPNVGSFSARQTKKGVSSRAWGQRKIYKGAFLINNNRVAVTRKTKARYPLKKLWGPSITKLFEGGQGSANPEVMQKTADQRFPINFDHEMKWRLSRLR